MTVAEFFGCSFLAFSLPTAMFCFTIANDPVRIILLIASSFFWLLSLLVSSLIWFPLRNFKDYLLIGVVFSVAIQEGFRYLIFKLLDKTRNGLEEVAGDSKVTHNKHILAYVSGLGIGIISGVFQIVNILADSVGPATMGLKAGNEYFFLTSATQTLFMILLNTFWTVIWFSGLYTNRKQNLIYVVGTHLFISCLTFLNRYHLYSITLTLSGIITILSALYAYLVAGGSPDRLKKFFKCQQ